MDFSLTTYREYFRDLAVRHKEILHDVDAEGPEGNPAERHFIRFTHDDVISNGISTSFGNRPCIALQDYQWVPSDNGYLDYRRNYSGSFMVIQKAIINNPASTEAVKLLTEQIMQEIEYHMMLDINRVPGSKAIPFNIVDWGKGEVVPVGPIWNNCYGFYKEFYFQLPVQNIDIQQKVFDAFNNPDFVTYSDGTSYIDVGGGQVLHT